MASSLAGNRDVGSSYQFGDPVAGHYQPVPVFWQRTLSLTNDGWSMMQEFGTDRLLKIDDVTRMSGMSKSSIYRGVADGSFPAPLRAGVRAARWRLSDIIRWIESLPTTSETPLH